MLTTLAVAGLIGVIAIVVKLRRQLNRAHAERTQRQEALRWSWDLERRD